MNTLLLERFSLKRQEIENWLADYEARQEVAFYHSADIRDAGFKTAIVDTNLFPAGFNNLSHADWSHTSHLFRQAIFQRLSDCRKICLLIEEHSRNLWYLENIFTLKTLLQNAGFEVSVFTVFEVAGLDYQHHGTCMLTTASGNLLEVGHPSLLQSGALAFDLYLLNHDLMQGMPGYFSRLGPMLPSPLLGWHSRLKSIHFRHKERLLCEFSSIVGVDSWFFRCLDRVVSQVDINEAADRERLAAAAESLFQQIEEKYREYQIAEKPFLFLKADYGTYGMGLLPIESPADILELNRKNRNRLFRGKGSRQIDSFLLQEGVPTIHNSGQDTAEVCIYQVNNQPAGAFWRLNREKSGRDNLNSNGMYFQSIDAGAGDLQLQAYHVLGRIAGIAAWKENTMQQAEKNEFCISCG